MIGFSLKYEKMSRDMTSLHIREVWSEFSLSDYCYSEIIWASSWENLTSGVSDQVRLKLACAATEAS